MKALDVHLYGKWKKNMKMGKCGKNGFLEENHDFGKILNFLLAKSSVRCFGPGVEEQVGEESLGERP